MANTVAQTTDERLPIATGNVPIDAGRKPGGALKMPIGSKKMPIEAAKVPIGSETMLFNEYLAQFNLANVTNRHIVKLHARFSNETIF